MQSCGHRVLRVFLLIGGTFFLIALNRFRMSISQMA